MKIKLSFTTCTITEAIEEINLVLKASGFQKITEDQLIDEKPVEKICPDDFDDTIFTFITELDGDKTINEVESTFRGTGIDIEICS